MDFQEHIRKAAAALAAGGVVCFPTETTYGLAVDPRKPEAVERLLDLKGRDEKQTIALIAADVAQVEAVVAVWPARAAELAAKHWPGPLTLVVPGKAELHPALRGPDGGVGIRVSAHPFARALASAAGTAITATSANLKGEPAACTCEQARRVFGEKIACYLDDGSLHEPGASTVVRITREGRCELLRSGPVVIEP